MDYSILSTLPAPAYIGIGAIIAAVITAFISFISLVTSKDQNISDHRQAWINSIREDISEFIGATAHVSACLYRFYSNPNETEREEQIDKLIFETTAQLATLYNRVILRLNPKENKDIIKHMEAIESFLAGEGEKPREDTDHLALLTTNLRLESQLMLKNEWKRVKRGEPTYFITKWTIITCILASLFYGYTKLSSFDNSATFNKSSEQQSTEKLPNNALQPTQKNSAAEL